MLKTIEILYQNTLNDLINQKDTFVNIEKDLEILSQVLEIYNNINSYLQHNNKKIIEDFVSKGLTYIYNEDHKFEMRIVDKRNKKIIEFWLKDNNTEIQLKSPFVGKGGGKIDSISLLLKIAVILQLGLTSTIFLDEVTKQVDFNATERIIEFLKDFQEENENQIILITHKDVAAADIYINKKDGESYIERR